MKKYNAVCIYWKCSKEAKQKIRTRFSITDGTSVNGETYAVISHDDWALFEETRRRGFFEIRSGEGMKYFEVIKRNMKRNDK